MKLEKLAHFQSELTFLVKWSPGPTFIKPDQFDPWIKDQIRNAPLSTMLSLQLPIFVSCGRACPSTKLGNRRGEIVDKRVIFI